MNRKQNRKQLATYNESIRAHVDARIRRIGRTWNWLGSQAESNDIACTAAITHWGNGRVQQVGCGVYHALIDILDAEEARMNAPIRIRGAKA
jgi:hypothetical protein